MNEKILVIAAHPDDETLGMGGTIAKHTSKGDVVHVIIITDGSSSQYQNYKEMIKKKKNEVKKAMKILGAGKIEFNTLPDMKLDTVPHVEINSIIEKKIEKYKPSTIYTHHWGDINKDHQLVFESTMVSVRPNPNQPVKEIYTYETPSSTEWNTIEASKIFKPNVFVDTTKYIDKKIKAVEAYETELRPYPHPRSPEAIETYDKRNGITIGTQYAERFYLIRKII